jgi:glycosyltransferase involved in cell wall biosynthesis
MSLPVTVVIPVKNEEKNLATCLQRLGKFADILVVDSGSTDSTLEIAAIYSANVLQFSWDGAFPKKRNWALLNYNFKTEWVLFLDADEVVDDSFCSELAKSLQNTDKAGYWINYRNYFLGQPIRYGISQRKLALFRVGCGLYERIEENAWSGLDMEIHEHPVLSGPVGELTSCIDHRDFRGLDSFLKRHIEYAKWEAERYQALHDSGLNNAVHLTERQRFKYRHLGKWWYPWLYFSATYFFKFGFLDGRTGFATAFYKAWYFETIRQFLIEKRIEANS